MTFRLSDRTVGFAAQALDRGRAVNADLIAYHLAREVQDSRGLARELRRLLRAALSPQCTHTHREVLLDTARFHVDAMWPDGGGDE